ncbi:hypothetical protein POV27_07625 [Aureisphaera galaxeae]|uniref:hypothetical protein n=1 Tax=Aureisphaera galaxeae TaxID=1538023 RepID=UPI00235030A6|nr:hypothetical protein [Aureisphaera galaxeae]MDC8003917.1 hypothetical protein [Aureisphaera galaxeae]
MIKKSILFLLILISTFCYSQEAEEQTETQLDVAFAPGLIYQGNFFADLNILIGEVTVDLDSKIPIVGIKGFRIGMESNFRDNENFTIAPKIGYEISPMLYTLRLSALNYFQNGNSEFRILPEIGLSLGGWGLLTYGYGIAFNDGNLNNVSNHRVSLSFNLNKRLRKGTFELLKR